MRTCLFLVILSAAFFSSSQAYPGYSKLIPNGDRVPHPCNRSLIWKGVGHELPLGPGPRQQFGLDFTAAGKTWSADLCRKDSDGDGKTNGEELGDPSCVWKPGSTPAVTDLTKLSHPGVCEPLDSPRCTDRNKFLSTINECVNKNINKTSNSTTLSSATPANSGPNSAAASWCPALAAPFVQSMTLRFDNTQLPAQDTYYMCKQFTVPNDKAYHMIAFEPVIANAELVHHLIVYSCDLPDEEAYLQQTGGYPNASECPMTPACSSMVVIWAFGAPKRCFGDEVGIPLGKGFYKTMILQVHYSNPSRKGKMFDSSGVVMYYTPVLRPNEKAMLALGQTEISVPPRTKSAVVVSKGFSGDCSKKQLAPYQSYRLVSVQWHMHRAGVGGKLVLTRSATGQRLTIIDEAMVYDRPKFISWDAANQLAVEPGDSFEIECRYDTSSRSNWTYWGGFSSQDEMCYAFIDIYPRPQNRMFLMPADLGDLSFCEQRAPVIGNCTKNTVAGVLQNTESNKSSGMMAACGCPGVYPAQVCTSNCYSFLSRAGFLKNPCMSGMAFQAITRFWVSMIAADIYNIQSQTDLCIKQALSPPTNNTACPAPVYRSSSGSDGQGGGEGNGSASYGNLPCSQLLLLTVIASLTFFHRLA